MECTARSLTQSISLSAALPRKDPTIMGVQKGYTLGEELKANCTADKSHPAATLQWFINGKEVGAILVVQQNPTLRGCSCDRVKFCCLP